MKMSVNEFDHEIFIGTNNNEDLQNDKLPEIENLNEPDHSSEPLSTSINETELPINFKKKEHRCTPTLFLTMCVIMIGTGAQFGYSIGCMNPAAELIKNRINEIYFKRHEVTMSAYRQNLVYSIVVSVMAFGGARGGLIGKAFNNQYSRKISLLFNNIPMIIGCSLMFVSKFIDSFEILIMGRLLIGFSVGFGITVGFTYINEISPSNLRGIFIAWFQLFAASALLLSQILGLNVVLGCPHLWSYLFVVPIIFNLIQSILLPFVHESPIFLLQNGRRVEAERALKWFRQEQSSENIRGEIDEIVKALESIRKNTIEAPIRDVESERRRWICCFISNLLHAIQNLNANVIIFSFGNLILSCTKLDIEYTPYVMLSCGITYVAVAISLILIINRIARRTLFLYTLVGIACVSFVIAVLLFYSNKLKIIRHDIIFLQMFFMMVYVGFCAAGPGILPWIVSTEMFSKFEHVYASKSSIVVFWLSMFFITLTFVPLFDAINGFLFGIYGIMSFIFWSFIFRFLPETRLKAPEQIQEFVQRFS